MVVTFDGLLHNVVFYFFRIIIVFMLVRIILSWVQLAPANPVMRFFSNIVDPVINPIARRLPRLSFGAFDIGYTVAFIFMWWALSQL